MTECKMEFEVLKQSMIDNVFVPAEAGRFVTNGYQGQRKSAEVVNLNSQFTVYFSEGDLSKASGAAYGSVMHDVAFRFELVTVTNAKVDLAVLNNENASADAKATALRGMLEAGAAADVKMDAFIRTIFQIFMDARNEQMGMVPPADQSKRKLVSNRWIDQIRKDTPITEGESVILTASMRATCRIEETITGDDLPVTPPGGAVLDGDIALDGDDVAEQGVEVTT